MIQNPVYTYKIFINVAEDFSSNVKYEQSSVTAFFT